MQIFGGLGQEPHELAVIMTLLRECEPLIAERFIRHREVGAYRAMKQYREHQDRAKLTPISEADFEEARETADSIIAEYGQEMKTDYGWASPVLNNKRPTLYDLEKHVQLDHWRALMRLTVPVSARRSARSRCC